MMFVSWYAARRAPQRDLRWPLWSGIVSRLVLFATPAFLSHDVARYLWDGYLVTVGLDPYRLTPESAAALYLTWPAVVDNRQIAAVYPPGAVALFALCARSGPALAPWLWRALATLSSIGVLLVSDKLLHRSARRHHLPWVALSPLLIVESQVGGHVDAMAALALLAALCGWRRQRDLLAGLALGAGALVKLWPALALLPAVVIGGRRSLVRSGGGAALVVLVGYGGALMLGLQPWGGLDSLFGKCQFGSPLFAALAAGLGGTWSRVSLVVLFIAALALIAVRARQTRRLEPALLLTAAAPLVFSPVVYPWYLTALVPLTALWPRAWMVGWIVALPFSYEVIDRFDAAGVWEPAAWPLLLVALAWLIGGAIDLHRWLRARAQ